MVEFTSSVFKKNGKAPMCIIPVDWILDDGKCMWPPYKKQRDIDEAVVNRQASSAKWTVYDMRILASAGK